VVTDPIAGVTQTGIRTEDGTERATDVIVLATGFASHAFTAPMEITGVEATTLAEAWGELPRAYLGITVPGFPNLFLLYGPNTNGGTGSIVNVIESAMNHVLAALDALETAEATRIEVRRPAADAFDRELRRALANTVWHTGCTSWYLDENGNDPSQWPWTWTTYHRRTARLDPAAYAIEAAHTRRATTGRP
jgi:cation diffusion facilitator CzcD-associated flavoprotein CzcO